MSERSPYFLISGKGRSGSNRLLDILDVSRHSACRSEVNEIPGSAFFGIGGTLFPQDLQTGQVAALREAVASAAAHRSARDRLSQTDKIYLNRLSTPILQGLGSARGRRVLRFARLLEDTREWRLPALVLDRAALSKTAVVLKLNSCPAWAAALSEADGNCHIIHNLRDPYEYLQSWYNRFIGQGVGAASFTANFDDVPRLFAHFGRDDAARVKEPTEANIVEVELWRWRYINETLHALDDRTGRYLLVRYADIERDPVGAARRVYDFAKLPFEGREESRIRALRNDLFSKPHATRLDAQMCKRLISLVLEDSPLMTLLRDDDGRVPVGRRSIVKTDPVQG